MLLQADEMPWAEVSPLRRSEDGHLSAKSQSTKQLVDQFHEFSATAHLQRVQPPIQPGTADTGHMFSPQTVARAQNHVVDDIHAC